MEFFCFMIVKKKVTFVILEFDPNHRLETQI